MSQEQFAALLPIVSADLIGEITAAQGITESDAIQLLYRSKLYAALEQEETKLWQYSTPMQYAHFVQELSGKELTYPDV